MNSPEYLMTNNIIQNPLLKNKTEIEVDDTIVSLNLSNISQFFKNVYILTPFKNESYMEQLYTQQINKLEWEQLGYKLVLHETNIKILNNDEHSRNMIIAKSLDFNIFNHFNYEMTENIVLIPILDISYLNITKYLKIFENTNSLVDFYKIMVMNQLFNNKPTYNNNINIISIINNIDESTYWTKKYNCSFSITTLFKCRKLRFSNFGKIESYIPTVSKNTDYLQNIKYYNKYIDISSSITKNGYKLYKINSKSEISKQDIIILFSKLNNAQKYYLFCNLLISKKYCHLVINNYEIMKQMNNTINFLPKLFKYLIGYSWVRFYMEESIKKTWITKDDDFIFDINTASLLPVYPFSLDDPKSNPYMPILVNNKALNSSKNLGGLEFYNTLDKMFINQGIVDLDGFIKRMNLFISGDSLNNIFKDIDWISCEAAICGSIMAACIQKQHVLMSLFLKINNFDEKYNRYFNEYYAEADVDIMIRSKSNIDFLEKAKYIYNTVSINLCNYDPINVKPEHIHMKVIKCFCVFVNENYIKKNIVTDNLTYETILENINSPTVLEKIMPFIIQSDKYLSYELYDKYEVTYTIHLSENKKSSLNTNIESDHIDDISINTSYKVKISSIHIQRELELFQLIGDDFFTLVSKFHMPCVRAYYDGNNVYMTPSCISAHMTYMNIDYKYFAGSKDPIEIILKYRMRGFGTFLNSNELDRTINYVYNSEFWNNLYNIDFKNKRTINSFFGSLSLKNKVFQSRFYNQSFYKKNIPFVNFNEVYISNLPTILTHKTHNNFMKNMILNINEDIIKYIKINLKEDIPTVNFINYYGYVVQCKKWFIDFIFNNLEYKCKCKLLN